MSEIAVLAVVHVANGVSPASTYGFRYWYSTRPALASHQIAPPVILAINTMASATICKLNLAPSSFVPQLKLGLGSVLVTDVMLASASKSVMSAKLVMLLRWNGASGSSAAMK